MAEMQAALESYGTINLAKAIAPAERLASEGFEVPASLSKEMGNQVSHLRLSPETAGQFLVGGEEPYPESSVLVQPQPAESLALISQEGPDAFYEGAIADRSVTVDFGLDPAQALDAEWIDQQPGKGMTIEQGRSPPLTHAKLIARGHKFERRETTANFRQRRHVLIVALEAGPCSFEEHVRELSTT